MTYDPNNIFAKILKGDIPCNKAYEDEHVFAFHDIAPQAPVHVLVIPKGQYVDLSDFSKNASEQEIMAFHRAVAHLTTELGLNNNGYRAIANSGSNGGQEVPHYHLHLLGGRPMGVMVS
ncbi:MAG: histidine triad nucleotide-binding protein [Alphaproteobacteria bacterium]|nr:histidine triad nucleotide-binding protein [Alphaproteobacteria bacterium]NCQ88496.1 histidine triad nucleotide-binding protein [Alphaproteobacteria bacterium]NCT06039.1 histidine triad nucleotide-binding protein [Alphaproteobacteria bacterium]